MALQCTRGCLFLLLLALLATFVTANDNNTCANAKFKSAPFMKKPVSNEDLDKLMAPVWWIMEGKGFASFDKSQIKPDLMNYLKQYSMEPIAGVGALFAITLLTLLIFLLWRFMRCLCVCCCQQEAYADAGKVLFSRRLYWYKRFMILLGLIGMAMAAWGIASLNKNFPTDVSKEIDTIQEFPAKMIAQVNLLADQTQNITAPLNSFKGIIKEINITGMQADLDDVSYFFTNAPKPADIKAALAQLQAALNTNLTAALDALAAEISGSNSSAFEVLRAHINVLRSFSIDFMKTELNAYDARIKAVVNMTATNTSDISNTAYVDLQDMQDDMKWYIVGSSGQPGSWLKQIAAARASAAAVDAARTNTTTNPFIIIKDRLGAVDASLTDIKNVKLVNLRTKIDSFNTMWHTKASPAIEDLMGKAIFVNSSVMLLPADVQPLITSMNDSLRDVNAMYTGADSLDNVPGNIDALGANLTMPDTAALVQNLNNSNNQLFNSGPDLASMIQVLDNLTSALNTLKPHVDSIGSALDIYASSNNMSDWNHLQSLLTGADGGAVMATAAVFAAAELGTFKNSTADQIGTKMGEASVDMAQQSASVTDVKGKINDFDMSSFDSALTDAGNAFAALGDPATLTQPIRDLLTNIDGMTTTQFANVETMITENSGNIRKISDQIKSFAIDKLDEIQAKYLPAVNATAGQGGGGVVAKYSQYLYYGLMAPYAVVLVLMVLLFIVTLRNCPAGVCIFSFLLNLLLILFALLPVFYTIFLLLMRDTCANVEALAIKAITIKSGNGSLPTLAVQFYLGGGKAPDGTDMSVKDLLKQMNADYDIDALKAKVNDTVSDMLVTLSEDYQFQTRVQNILDDVVLHVQGIMAGVDGLVELLDYPSISGVWYQIKSWLCCDLADQLFVQWAACVVLLAMAWVALQCALLVLKNLDGLSDSCCACSCYKPSDYQAGSPEPERKRLSSVESGDGAVAVININATGAAKGSKTYEMIDATPLPPPLAVMQSAPSAPVMSSPRMYPSITAPQGMPGDLQQQRMSLMGPAAMYGGQPQMAGGYGYGQQPPPQQGWGRQSPSPSNAMYPGARI